MERANYGARIRSLGRVLLVVEAIVCFGPLIIAMTLGLWFLPGVLATDHVPSDTGILLAISLSGILGIAGLILVLARIINPAIHAFRSECLWLLILCGFLAFFAFHEFDLRTALKPKSFILGLLPFLCALHVIWLGRGFLFRSDSPTVLKTLLTVPVVVSALLIAKEIYQIHKYRNIEVVDYATLMWKLEYGEITTNDLKIGAYDFVTRKCDLITEEISNLCRERLPGRIESCDRGLFEKHDTSSLGSDDVYNIIRRFNACI